MQPKNSSKVLFWLIALVLVLSSCRADGADQSVSPDPVATDEATETPTVAPPAEEPTASELASNEAPTPIEEIEEPTTILEIDIRESELVEAEIVEWERGDQGELILTVFAQNACVLAEVDCDDTAADTRTVIAVDGATRFELPIEIAPNTVEIVEVSHQEFAAFLEGGSHPGAVDPQQGDRFVMALDPELETGAQDDSFDGLPRFASQIALVGASNS